MASVQDFIDGVADAGQKLSRLVELEQQVSEEEKMESAEIQQVENIARQLQQSDRSEIPREEIQDFAHAVKLLERVSSELVETGSDLESVIREIESNSEEEHRIIGGLGSGKIKVADSSELEELAGAVSTRQENIDRAKSEAKKGLEEAKKARRHQQELASMDWFLSQAAEKSDLSDADEALREIEQQLETARSTLADAVETAEQLESQEAQVLQRINPEMDRRDFLRAGAAATAMISLPGCSAAGLVDAENFTDNHVYTGRLQFLGVIGVRGERLGLSVGQKQEVPVYRGVDLVPADLSIQEIFIVDTRGKLEGLDLEKCETTGQSFRVKVAGFDVDDYGAHPEIINSPCLEASIGEAPQKVGFGMPERISR
ncbi:MAG: twin-arginine translocation signal domain-containing protein [Candidatus Nanohaloarchaea archaeon]